ncbi:hypothetical protein MY4824_009728 [Beauveria thailandica]
MYELELEFSYQPIPCALSITYIVCDFFWVISIKRFGANRVLGVAIIGWSASTLATGFVKSYKQAMACRLILAAFESGLLPRAFGGFIAYGIQTVGTRRGLEA